MTTDTNNKPKQKFDDLFTEAWQLTKGFKWCAISTLLLAWVIATVIGVIASALFGVQPDPVTHKITISFGGYFTVAFVESLFLFPLALMGARRALDLPANLGDAMVTMFNVIYKVLGFLIVFSLSTATLQSMIPYISTHPAAGSTVTILVLAFISTFIIVTTIFAALLVMIKQLNPLQALSQTSTAIIKNWGLFLGVGLVMGAILLLSAIPLGLGLIWTMPMSYILQGILFRNIFGLTKAEPSATDPNTSELMEMVS